MIFLIYLITMMRALICRICNHGNPLILQIMVKTFSEVFHQQAVNEDISATNAAQEDQVNAVVEEGDRAGNAREVFLSSVYTWLVILAISSRTAKMLVGAPGVTSSVSPLWM